MAIISCSITLIVVVTCLTLANWQYNRAQDKQQRLDYISTQQAQGTMNGLQLNSLPKHLNKTGIKVQLTGQLQSKQYWLLDNRIFHKQVGFDLLAMFTPEQSKQAIIVNLGWIKAPQRRDQSITVQLPTATITLTMQLKQGDLTGFYLQAEAPNNSAWPKRIQYIDLSKMQLESSRQFQDFIGYSNEARFSLQPHYQPVVMPPEKHIAYALQWLLLALAALVIFIFANKPFLRSSL